MRQITVWVAAVVAIAAAPTGPAEAQGTATTTFVSGNGLDTNPCTVAAPCRSFQHAHDLTAAGGQITMLDPAGYGAVTITKAISIVNDGGGEAGITDLGAGVDAITINAGASEIVNLRGLTLNGIGAGNSANNGINFRTGAALNIQNCVIRDFLGAGVSGFLTVSTALTISDTILSHNSEGIVLTAGDGTIVTTDVERVAAVDNISSGFAFLVFPAGTGRFQGAIRNSVASGNGLGFDLSLGSGGAITLINSKGLQNVGTGLSAKSGTTYLSRVTLSGNQSGFSVSGGTLKTFGDTYIIDTNNTGALSPIALE